MAASVIRHGYEQFCLESVDSRRYLPVEACRLKVRIVRRAGMAEVASAGKLGSPSWRSSRGSSRFLSCALLSISKSRSLALLIATPHNKPLNQTVF